VWPDAPLLRGVTMQLLEEGLPRIGVAVRRERVPVGDVARFDGAFLSNARGIAAVSAVDDVELPEAREWMRLLEDVYGSVPWDPI
jgi:branched-subunit amino acid aminotransferase/4-amino-4-deoxychorismate lyase